MSLMTTVVRDSAMPLRRSTDGEKKGVVRAGLMPGRKRVESFAGMLQCVEGWNNGSQM